MNPIWQLSRDRTMSLFEEKICLEKKLDILTKALGKAYCYELTDEDINSLYWAGGNSGFLSRSLGIKQQFICNYEGIIKPKTILRCQVCGDEFEYEINSLSDNTHKGIYTCYVCEKKKDDNERMKYLQHTEEALDEKDSLCDMPYSDYLQTDHWQNIRKEALRRAGYRCQVCNCGGLLDVHHRTYENKGYERWNDVIVLCRNCHQVFHEVA